MNTLGFLEELRERDILVQANGDRLRCSAPPGALTLELRDQLQQRKPDILRFLRSAESLAQAQRAIVPLQPRGTLTPVFAVAGHNGDVFCYRALARHLGDNQPFFGLQPPGLDGHSEPLTRVEDLAAYFTAQIREFQPNGPYVIAGYCAGGTIAFELGRQLLRDGAVIKVLALFGSPFSTWYRFVPQLRYRLRNLLERVVRHTRALTMLSFAEKRSYVAGKLRDRKAQQAAERPTAPVPVLVQRAKVERATFMAVRRYTPDYFAGRLGVFLPTKVSSDAGLAMAHWQSVAEHAKEYAGPDGCDSAMMLREPYAAAFAALFTQSVSSSPEWAP